MTKMYLLDVNLWVALTFRKHAHHASAKAWFDTISDGDCSFCRMTQQGFLRLATNPKALGADAVSMTEAWRLFDALLADPRVVFVDEPPGVETLWRDQSNRLTFTPKAWNDAFLAAFAEASSLELVTFDKGIAKFPRVRVKILK